MGKRILVVDDEIAILMAFKKLFEDTEIIVDIANTKEDAMKLLKIRVYDAVITDLRLTNKLPDEGLEILSFVKENHPNTRMILITAYGNEKIKEKITKLSALYFEKPISGKLLKETLKKLEI